MGTVNAQGVVEFQWSYSLNRVVKLLRERGVLLVLGARAERAKDRKVFNKNAHCVGYLNKRCEICKKEKEKEKKKEKEETQMVVTNSNG